MPKERRLRGKKHKTKQSEVVSDIPDAFSAEEVITGEPSWIRSVPQRDLSANAEEPFGYVDQDVKAYFRTVDLQIRDWHEGETEQEDVDPNEQRRLFFMAALTEMNGKEKQLATDPECSIVLERMSYSMDDFMRRVFLDSLAGSYEALVQHRFASHVCQTMLTVAKDTISREAKGIFPQVADTPNKGELRTLTQLIHDISMELLPSFSSLIMDPFASHVIRALLLLLCPNISPDQNRQQPSVRSKKSSSWKARQGPMKSIFGSEKGKARESPHRSTLPVFGEIACKFVQTLREELDENEVRALATNKVASPALQILLEVEADQGFSEEPGSLMDRVMVGLITALHNGDADSLEPSDYLNTLLRDPTSSHLLETVMSRASDPAFTMLWNIYLRGKLPRLANHPVANFVLAKALERASTDQLLEACTDLADTWSKMIKASRTGILRAVLDRAVLFNTSQQGAAQALCSAFDLNSEEDYKLLVPCALAVLPIDDYRAAISKGLTPEMKVQGGILLQSFLRLSSDHHHIALTSIFALPIEDRIRIAHNAVGSRVYDALLVSSTVASKSKQQFVMDFINHYHLLVDDRFGSHVGDNCWSFADTYLKEKIARSLIPQEHVLSGSFYGKFFARHLNLYLLRRRPEEWRDMQADKKRQAQGSKHVNQGSLSPKTVSFKGVAAKRKLSPNSHDGDDIDAVFDLALGKKIKRTALDKSSGHFTTSAEGLADGTTVEDYSRLSEILGAIKTAPKEHGKWRKRNKR